MLNIYDFLTAGYCFKVFDVETTTGEDEHRRIVAIAVADIVDGVVSDEVAHWLINPEEPIDAQSQEIHGITDADVADQPTFAALAPDIINALSSTPTPNHTVVWVAHNAGFDMGVLGWALDQCDVAMPEVLVLDTYRLPEQLDQEPRKRLSLPHLADALGVGGLEHHNPISDAHTTAKILHTLLTAAAANGVATPEQLLSHGKLSTGFPMDNLARKPATIHPAQPETHTKQHPEPLPPQPTALQRKQWALAFLRCADAGCEHVRVLSEQLWENPQLFQSLTKQANAHIQPRSVGVATLLGALNDPLLLASLGDRKALVTTWLLLRRTLSPTACPTDATTTRCPDCREGKPCPVDVFHHSVAQRFCGTHIRGVVSKNAIDSFTRSRQQLTTWAGRGAIDLAAYAAWLCLDAATSLGELTSAGKIRAHAEYLHLDEVEPRLAILSAVRLIATQRKGAARELVENVLAAANTDPAFEELSEYRAAHLLPVPEPERRVVKTQERFGVTVRRPANRKGTPRFKLS